MPFVSAPGQTTAKPQKGVSGKKVPLSLLESQSPLVYRRKKTKTFKTTNPVYLNPVLQHPPKNFKAGAQQRKKEREHPPAAMPSNATELRGNVPSATAGACQAGYWGGNPNPFPEHQGGVFSSEVSSSRGEAWAQGGLHGERPELPLPRANARNIINSQTSQREGGGNLAAVMLSLNGIGTMFMDT